MDTLWRDVGTSTAGNDPRIFQSTVSFFLSLLLTFLKSDKKTGHYVRKRKRAGSLTINTNRKRYFHQKNSLVCPMESLESKLDRLSPEQRKEVEDFVEFLIFRSGIFQELPAASPVQPRIQDVAPPLIIQEPVHILENSPVKGCDTIPVENPSDSALAERPTPFHEISAKGDDRISRDYMDYGQFDRSPSPATTAVQKVKEKLQKREEDEKPRVSLDWI
jgi:hypothetical protein